MMKILGNFLVLIALLGGAVAPSFAQSRGEHIGSLVAWSGEMNRLSQDALILLDTAGADEAVALYTNSLLDAGSARQRLDDWRGSADGSLDDIEARFAALRAGPEIVLDEHRSIVSAQRAALEDLIGRIRLFLAAQYTASSDAIAGNEVEWPIVAAAQYAVFQQMYVGQIRQNLTALRNSTDQDPEGAWGASVNENLASFILVLEMVRIDWGAPPSEFAVDDPVDRLRERQRTVRDHAMRGRRALRDREREIERSPPSTERGYRLLPLLEQNNAILETALALEEEMSAALLEAGRRIASGGVSEDALAQIQVVGRLEEQRAENQQRRAELAQQMFPSGR